MKRYETPTADLTAWGIQKLWAKRNEYDERIVYRGGNAVDKWQLSQIDKELSNRGYLVINRELKKINH